MEYFISTLSQSDMQEYNTKNKIKRTQRMNGIN